MPDRSAYIFVCPKRPGDTTVALRHHEQFVPRGEKILLSDEDYERLKDYYELTPVATTSRPSPTPVVPAPTPVATTPSEPAATSVPRSSIPVKPSPDDESPNAAL
jgi:hypothetical protein